MKTCSRCGETRDNSFFGVRRSQCNQCRSALSLEWSRKNPERARARSERWRRARGIQPPPPLAPEAERQARRAASRRKWLANNKGKMAAARKAWVEKYPSRAAELTRRQQAARIKAVPSWVDFEATAEFYAEAKRLTLETGIPHEVDHIIPINSPVVCGLHWEANLQVLPRSINRSKGNRLDAAQAA